MQAFEGFVWMLAELEGITAIPYAQIGVIV
jgi:hypothetical protein